MQENLTKVQAVRSSDSHAEVWLSGAGRDPVPGDTLFGMEVTGVAFPTPCPAVCWLNLPGPVGVGEVDYLHN